MDIIAVKEVENGLFIPDNISEDQHRALGERLSNALNQAEYQLHNCQWKLGDWYNAIAWGNKGDYCKAVGISSSTASHCGSVAAFYNIAVEDDKLSGAGQFKQGDKPHRTILPFTTHQMAMQGTTGEQAHELLVQAILAKKGEGKYWTSRRMADEVRKLLSAAAYQPREEPAPQPAPPTPFRVPAAPPKPVDKTDPVQQALSRLPEETSPKAQKAVRDLIFQLGSQYHEQVREGIKAQRKLMTKEREALRAEKEAYEKLLKGCVRPIEKKEYRELVQFCHPDKHPENVAKATKIANLVRKLGDALQYTK